MQTTGRIKVFLTLAFLIFSISKSHAFEINSLEKAYQIPNLKWAIEVLRPVKTKCGIRGTDYHRYINIRFNELEEEFIGYLSTSFKKDSQINVNQQQYQQLQCQQPQSHQILSNTDRSRLYYIPNLKSITNEFPSLKLMETFIKEEISNFLDQGSLLAIEGGSAWRIFKNISNKSSIFHLTLNEGYRNVQVQFAYKNKIICVNRLTTHIYGGFNNTFCVRNLQ